jgi:hypothetical protein
MSLIYDRSKHSLKLLTILDSIRKLHSTRISFVFLADTEFDKSLCAESLQNLYGHFFQNVVWGKDYEFDTESAELLFANFSASSNHSYSPGFIKKASRLSHGDPVVLKHLAYRALSLSGFSEEFENSKEIKAIYELVDKEFLDYRYRGVMKTLKRESLRCLLGDYKDPTEFLLMTGIIRAEKSKNIPLNELFGHFVGTKNNILDYYNVSNINTNHAAIREKLSGQELTLFEELLSKEGVILSKESIAKIIWGESWETSYSDWAIDKLISNLRKKLQGLKYPRTIKSYKGKGIMLT